jgi:lipid II:glycine glycyltransferase (peptidoglycan interpeptide bridge formation enzyme)
MTHDDRDWELTQAHLKGHFLQSTAWAKFQSAMDREVVRAAGKGWSYQGFVMNSRGVSYLYCPYGPTLAPGTDFDDVIASWREVGKSLKCDFVRFEPVGSLTDDLLVESGANKVKDFQAKDTLVLNLTKSEEHLRAELSASHRNTINAAERKGLSFREGTVERDGERFLEFMRGVAERRGFRSHPEEYFREMMRVLEPSGHLKLYVAEHEGAAVALALIFDYAGVRYYAHSGSDPAARSLRVMAPFVWYLAMEAKKAGEREFDLWGVAPDGAPETHPWAGFTEFKRSFGGVDKAYLGTWELPLRTGRYLVYLAAKKLRSLL